MPKVNILLTCNATRSHSKSPQPEVECSLKYSASRSKIYLVLHVNMQSLEQLHQITLTAHLYNHLSLGLLSKQKNTKLLRNMQNKNH